MTRLDTATMNHLAKWCDAQFNGERLAVFNGLFVVIESIDGDELAAYLYRSWWHVYDVAKGLKFIQVHA